MSKYFYWVRFIAGRESWMVVDVPNEIRSAEDVLNLTKRVEIVGEYRNGIFIKDFKLLRIEATC